MMFIDGLPVTHTDGSAQNWKVDVLPFGAVAVPLDESLSSEGAGVGYEPSAHDSAGGVSFRMLFDI
jgi:hypothetical protein